MALAALSLSPPPRARPGSSSKSRGSVPDRFIPRRSTGGFSLFEQRQVTDASPEITADTSPSKKEYHQALSDSILLPVSPSQKILPLTLSPTSPGTHIADGRFFSLASPGGCNYGGKPPSACERRRSRSARLIPTSPDKILDAPDIVDDYYLNLLDWSPSNILAVGLGQAVYLFNAGTGAVHKLLDTADPENYITSLAWQGNTLAVGLHSATVQLWDVTANKPTRCMRGHTDRVASLSWASASSNTLSSGSRDGLIIQHDVRASQHKTATLGGHSAEVCGLKWSPTGSQLASGGNDNLLNIWEARQNRARHTIARHTAAVHPAPTSLAVSLWLWFSLSLPLSRSPALSPSGDGALFLCLALLLYLSLS